MRKFICLFLALLVLSANAFAAIGTTVTFSTGLSTQTAIINQPMHLYLNISNTGASAVNVTAFVPTATSTGAVGSKIPAAFSILNLGPNAVVSAPAGTTTSVPFDVVFFAPSTGITGSGSGSFTVGGVLYTSDGSVTAAASGAVATVNPVPLPLYQRL